MENISSAAAMKRPTSSKTSHKLKLKRVNTTEGVHPFDEITWVKHDAVIGSGDNISFEQKGVEFPDFWSANAVNITTSKYFRGKLDTPQRETSLKQLITRITSEIKKWGLKDGYFSDEVEAELFEQELAYLMVNQHVAFNSPVQFNVGTKKKPQCSACFILSVDDDMQSILEWIKTEGTIFKGGSGAGVIAQCGSSRGRG